MRIVVLGAKGFPAVTGAGGVERTVYELSTRLADIGHDVVVYERGTSPGTRVENGVTVRCTPFIDRRNLAGWSHLVVSTVDAAFRLGRVDVYHVHCAQNGFICPLLRLSGARVLFHLHGREWRASKWSTLMSRLFFLSCLAGTVGAHSVVTVCRPSRHEILSWLKGSRSKVWSVPNGRPFWLDDADTSAKAPGNLAVNALVENDRVPFFLYAGRLVPQKRIDLLIRAMQQLARPVRLALAGPVSHTDRYVQELRAECAGDERVVWLGQVDRTSLLSLYRRCVALVHPSNAEGCSNTLLEAIAAGCCVVSSDIEENREVLKDAALFFRSESLPSLIDVLQRLLLQPEEAERIRSAARVRAAELLSWDEVAERFAQLYGAACVDEDPGSVFATPPADPP